ncbi:MAG: DUF3298 domain-containing protein [Prevotella sp.]|nr:DUF3298 domain-containing protein [Prevotella sp.]
MKTKLLFLITAVSLSFASCGNKNAETAEIEDAFAYPLEIENYTFSDSSKYANISIKAVLPVSKDSVSQVIRDSLVNIIGNSIRSYQGSQMEDSKPLIAKYNGDEKDAKSMLDYYSKAVSKLLNSQAKEDYDERVKYWEEDTTLTEEQRKEFKEGVTPWDYSMDVTKTSEDSTFVVFNDTEYAYIGGAHGGVFGWGGITFRFSDGSIVKDFLKDNVLKDMQPLLKKGLKEYFNENADEKIKTDQQLMEQLMLPEESKGLIPLPAWTPSPDEKGKGLVFTYQQYEIACYAVGMPSFVLTWEELKPFLREDILEDIK